MNYYWWWWWWCRQSPISCRIPGEKNVGPGLVCTKVGLAIVVGDLWPGFSINVGMEPPTAMKKHRQNIGKMDQHGITDWSMIYWVRHLKHFIWHCRKLSLAWDLMDLRCPYSEWSVSSTEDRTDPTNPTDGSASGFWSLALRRFSGGSPAVTHCCWKTTICSRQNKAERTQRHRRSNRSLGNPEIGELKFGAQIQRQRLGRTFLLARIPKHPTLNERTAKGCPHPFLTLEESATKSLSSWMIFPNLNIRGDGTTAR